MGQPAKYLFDTDFDAMASSGPASAVELQQEITDLRTQLEETKQSAQAALASAKEQAYAEGMTAGKAIGAKETADTNEAKIAQAIEALGAHASGVFKDYDARIDVAQREALDVAVSVAQKLCAHLQDQSALNGLAPFLEETLREIRGVSQINVQVAPELATEVEAYLHVAPSFASVREKVSVTADESLPVGDAHIEWLDGQVSLSPSSLAELIERRVRLFLGYEEDDLQSVEKINHDDTASSGDDS